MPTAATLPRYIVLTAAAKMPSSCWGRYRRVAVVELDGTGVKPAMISERAKGVRRIVKTWERLHVGKTDRSAYIGAFMEATAKAAALNAEAVGEAA